MESYANAKIMVENIGELRTTIVSDPKTAPMMMIIYMMIAANVAVERFLTP